MEIRPRFYCPPSVSGVVGTLDPAGWQLLLIPRRAAPEPYLPQRRRSGGGEWGQGCGGGSRGKRNGDGRGRQRRGGGGSAALAHQNGLDGSEPFRFGAAYPVLSCFHELKKYLKIFIKN
jgi:hypothetical protein